MAMQTIEIDEPVKAGQGKARRYPDFKDGLLLGTETPGVTSLWSNFQNGVKVSGSRACLGHRVVVGGVAGEFVWQTYNIVSERAVNFGSGLLARGVAKGGFVGIYTVNRPEWSIAEHACNAFNLVTVPLYDTLGTEAIAHILNQTETTVVIVSPDKIAHLVASRAQFAHLKTLVVIGEVAAEVKAKLQAANLDLVTFVDLEEEGKKAVQVPAPGGIDDVTTIMYTSGTTGLPKGAMLTHRNLLSVVSGIQYMGKRGLGLIIEQTDTHLSYLPLAHCFERLVVTAVFGAGGRVGFYQGDTAKLLDDVGSLRPTIFPSVPRLLNRIYAKVLANVEAAGGIKAALFNMALASKKEGLRQGYNTHWLWDRLVFGAVRMRLGGNVRTMVTGSAPIATEVLDFLRLAFSCEVHEGYGATETTAGSSLTIAKDYEPGHVGTPIGSCEMKLFDVPEMNYTSADQPFPRGEVGIRGSSVFIGYYKDEAKTKEALDADGWYRTGDIGMWDARGRLRLIDRKKNIFKLAQGEYIAPEKIENIYQQCKYVGQAFVHGESLKAYLVGVIVPDEEQAVQWCKENGETATTLAEAVKSEGLKKAILAAIVKLGKDLGLKSFEQVKAIHLDSTPFSVENDLLTPSFKLRRPQAKAYYQSALDAIYTVLDAEDATRERAQ